MARPTLDRNPKFKGLCRRLGIPRPHARGYLELIWDTANECGMPVFASAEVVEDSAEWEGEPGALSSALLSVGFIDEMGDGRMIVHDYWEHCPDYVFDRLRKELERKGVKVTREEIREQARDNPAALRESLMKSWTHPDKLTDNPGQSRTVPDSPRQSSAPAPAPAPTHMLEHIQSATEGGVGPLSCSVASLPSKKPKRKASPLQAQADATGFAEWWTKWPVKVGLENARKAWVNDLTNEERSGMMQLTENYFINRRDASQRGKFVSNLPHPGTFLRQKRWTDDFGGRPKQSASVPREETKMEIDKIKLRFSDQQEVAGCK